jgi:hypothetical protein
MAEPPRVALDPACSLVSRSSASMRLAVAFVNGLFADGWSEAETIANYSDSPVQTFWAALPMRRRTVIIDSDRCFP